MPTSDAKLPAVAALLLAAYPLIDVVASLALAHRRPDGTPQRVNATISALAAVVVGATAFAADGYMAVGAVLYLVSARPRRAPSRSPADRSRT